MKDIEAGVLARRQKRRGDSGDDDDAAEFAVTCQPQTSFVYNIYLFGAIVDPNQFIGAIEVLNRATEDDVVFVHLQTPGGSIDATDTFLSAMRGCEADVIVRASGGVHSAGTIILMNAPSFQLSRNFNALIHNGSTGAGGKFSDFKAMAKAAESQMEDVLRQTYEGFLSPKELDDLIGGKDYWLDGKQFSERFNKRQEFLKAKYGQQTVAPTEETDADEAPQPQKPARKSRAKKTPQP